ncbi:MAG: hypothetical protein IJ899_21990 [Blautia sp.]|nr:hypothetical protein [Blautia sp.]
MKGSANGISPIVAIILTVLVGYCTCRLFLGGHKFWGVVFIIIFLDFLADVLLSLKKD